VIIPIRKNVIRFRSQKNISSNMKAIFVPKIGQIELKTLPIPETLPSSIIVKVLYSRISYAAKNRALGNYKPDLIGPAPFIPGCSCVGIIQEIGKDINSDKYKVGDVVVVTTPIGEFPHGILLGVSYFGSEESKRLANLYRNGCFAEYVRVPVTNIHKIQNPQVDLIQFTMVSKLSIAYNCFKKNWILCF